MDDKEGIRLCSICLEIFENPKIIPCYHTFCEKCLDQHIRTHRRANKFRCPLCREEICVPVGGASTFKNNFYIDETKEPKCSCSREISTHYCKTCVLLYCARCIIRNHRLHDILELSDFCEEIKEKLTGLKDELQKELDKLKLFSEDLEHERGEMISARDVAYADINAIVDKKCLKMCKRASSLKQKIGSLCNKQDIQLSIIRREYLRDSEYLSKLKRGAEESINEFVISKKEIIPEIETALQDQRNKVYSSLLLTFPVFSNSSLDSNASDDLGTFKMIPKPVCVVFLQFLPETQPDIAFQYTSSSLTVNNLNWTIQASHHYETRSLGIYVCLNQVQCDERLKSCVANFSIKLVNGHDDSKSVTKRFTSDEIAVGGLGKGWYKFVDWNEFVGTDYGFSDDLGNFAVVFTNFILKRIY